MNPHVEPYGESKYAKIEKVLFDSWSKDDYHKDCLVTKCPIMSHLLCQTSPSLSSSLISTGFFMNEFQICIPVKSNIFLNCKSQATFIYVFFSKHITVWDFVARLCHLVCSSKQAIQQKKNEQVLNQVLKQAHG